MTSSSSRSGYEHFDGKLHVCGDAASLLHVFAAQQLRAHDADWASIVDELHVLNDRQLSVQPASRQLKSALLHVFDALQSIVQLVACEQSTFASHAPSTLHEM